MAHTMVFSQRDHHGKRHICTAFVGVWGMNFEHMPELKWRYGYPAALLLIVSVCSYVYYRFRKAGWL